MANRYWVGGTGTWDGTTTHWSATSGGAPGASAPGASDVAVFDANSGGGVVTIAGTTQQLLGGDTSGFIGTIVGTGAAMIQLSASAVSFTGSPAFTDQTINFTFLGNTTLNCGGGSYGVLTVTRGGTPITVDLYGSGTFKNIDFGASGACVLNFNTSTLTFTTLISAATGFFRYTSSSNRPQVNMNSSIVGFNANLAANTSLFGSGLNSPIFDFGTSQVTVNVYGNFGLYVPSTSSGMGAQTYNNLTFNLYGTSTAQIVSFQLGTGWTVNDLTVQLKSPGTAATFRGYNYTVNGTLTLRGISASNRLTINGTNVTNTITKTSGTVNTCDFLAMSYSTATGGATFLAGGGSLNSGNNSGWAWGSGWLVGGYWRQRSYGIVGGL